MYVSYYIEEHEGGREGGVCYVHVSDVTHAELHFNLLLLSGTSHLLVVVTPTGRIMQSVSMAHTTRHVSPCKEHAPVLFL